MSDERLDPAEAELQQWIDGLLETPTATPTDLRGEIAKSLRRKQRHTIALRSLTAVAAVLAIFLSLQQVPVSVDRKVVSTPNVTPIHKPPIATFTARSDLIAIPIISNDPTVTIIQLYPTTITQRRWLREAALTDSLQTSASPVQGG